MCVWLFYPHLIAQMSWASFSNCHTIILFLVCADTCLHIYFFLIICLFLIHMAVLIWLWVFSLMPIFQKCICSFKVALTLHLTSNKVNLSLALSGSLCFACECSCSYISISFHSICPHLLCVCIRAAYLYRATVFVPLFFPARPGNTGTAWKIQKNSTSTKLQFTFFSPSETPKLAFF